MTHRNQATDAGQFWKDYWDECARNATSDYTLNRCTTMRLEALEAEADRRLVADLSPQSTDVILDAGCGSGRNISLFASQVARMVGVDFSSEMLARLRTRLANEGLNNVILQQGSIAHLNFPDNSFDKVLCISV